MTHQPGTPTRPPRDYIDRFQSIHVSNSCHELHATPSLQTNSKSPIMTLLLSLKIQLPIYPDYRWGFHTIADPIYLSTTPTSPPNRGVCSCQCHHHCDIQLQSIQELDASTHHTNTFTSTTPASGIRCKQYHKRHSRTTGTHLRLLAHSSTHTCHRNLRLYRRT